MEAPIREAVRIAGESLAPGQLAWGEVHRWGHAESTDPLRVLRRRKLQRPLAHLRSTSPDPGLDRLLSMLHEQPRPLSQDWLGALADPRIGALVVRDLQGNPRGVLGFLGGRPSARPPGAGVPGAVSRAAEGQLWRRSRNRVPVVALAGFCGDARLRAPEAPGDTAWVPRATWLGEALAEAAGAAVTLATGGLERRVGRALSVEGPGISGRILGTERPLSVALSGGLRRGGVPLVAAFSGAARGVDPWPDGYKAILDLRDRLDPSQATAGSPPTEEEEIGEEPLVQTPESGEPALPELAEPLGSVRAPILEFAQDASGMLRVVVEGVPSQAPRPGTPSLVIERQAEAEGPWVPLLFQGRPADDLHQALFVSRARGGLRFLWILPLPRPWRGQRFRAVLAGIPSAPVRLR